MVEVSTLLIVLALVAAAAGGVGLTVLSWYRRKTGFRATWAAGGATTVVASDTGAAPSLLLRDPELGLRGRPDYLLTENTAEGPRVVPLELKPHRRSRRLYESDEVQVGAYLLLSRATYGSSAATFGYVRYANAAFRVELTSALERQIRAVVAAISRGRAAAVVHRSHAVPARCAGCAVRRYCDEALV